MSSRSHPAVASGRRAVRDQVVEEARLLSPLGADEKQAMSDLLRKLLLHFEKLMGPAPHHREQAEA